MPSLRTELKQSRPFASLEQEASPLPPEGYALTTGRGGFSTLNGPYFHKPGDGPMAEQAFFALARHCNGMGLVHGGMLSAFMDGVLAGAVWRGAGRAGLCRNDVTERLVAQVPDATRLLDRMEAMKLVARGRDADDRRMVNTRITGAGLTLLARLDAPTQAMHHRQLGHLGPAKLRSLIGLLALARQEG